MALSLEEVGELLAKMTYKDGWTFKQLERTPHKLEIRFWAVDSNGSGKKLNIPWYGSIPNDIENEEAFWEWLEGCILEVETHEVREWLRVDGRTVYPQELLH